MAVVVLVTLLGNALFFHVIARRLGYTFLRDLYVAIITAGAIPYWSIVGFGLFYLWLSIVQSQDDGIANVLAVILSANGVAMTFHFGSLLIRMRSARMLTGVIAACGYGISALTCIYTFDGQNTTYDFSAGAIIGWCVSILFPLQLACMAVLWAVCGSPVDQGPLRGV